MRSHSSTQPPDHFYDSAVRGSGIYSITCMPTGKVYVGSAVNLSLRWRQHFAHLEAGSHHCQHLQRAWKKYGSAAFTFAIIEWSDRMVLRSREQFHIDSVSMDHRFNSTPTAGSLLGFKMGPESLERMRVAHTGFRHSEETKARARIARAGIATRPAGWKMSADGRQKISKARTGKPLSPEHREKSAATLSRFNKLPHSPQHAQALLESLRSLSDEQVGVVRRRYLSGESMASISKDLGLGNRKTIARAIRGVGVYSAIGEPVTTVVSRPVSEDQRRKLSEATKGRPKSAETRENMRRAWAVRKASV